MSISPKSLPTASQSPHSGNESEPASAILHDVNVRVKEDGGKEFRFVPERAPIDPWGASLHHSDSSDSSRCRGGSETPCDDAGGDDCPREWRETGEETKPKHDGKNHGAAAPFDEEDVDCDSDDNDVPLNDTSCDWPSPMVTRHERTPFPSTGQPPRLRPARSQPPELWVALGASMDPPPCPANGPLASSDTAKEEEAAAQDAALTETNRCCWGALPSRETNDEGDADLIDPLWMLWGCGNKMKPIEEEEGMRRKKPNGSTVLSGSSADGAPLSNTSIGDPRTHKPSFRVLQRTSIPNSQQHEEACEVLLEDDWQPPMSAAVVDTTVSTAVVSASTTSCSWRLPPLELANLPPQDGREHGVGRRWHSATTQNGRAADRDFGKGPHEEAGASALSPILRNTDSPKWISEPFPHRPRGDDRRADESVVVSPTSSKGMETMELPQPEDRISKTRAEGWTGRVTPPFYLETALAEPVPRRLYSHPMTAEKYRPSVNDCHETTVPSGEFLSTGIEAKMHQQQGYETSMEHEHLSPPLPRTHAGEQHSPRSTLGAQCRDEPQGVGEAKETAMCDIWRSETTCRVDDFVAAHSSASLRSLRTDIATRAPVRKPQSPDVATQVSEGSTTCRTLDGNGREREKTASGPLQEEPSSIVMFSTSNWNPSHAHDSTESRESALDNNTTMTTITQSEGTIKSHLQQSKLSPTMDIEAQDIRQVSLEGGDSSFHSLLSSRDLGQKYGARVPQQSDSFLGELTAGQLRDRCQPLETEQNLGRASFLALEREKGMCPAAGTQTSTCNLAVQLLSDLRQAERDKSDARVSEHNWRLLYKQCKKELMSQEKMVQDLKARVSTLSMELGKSERANRKLKNQRDEAVARERCSYRIFRLGKNQFQNHELSRTNSVATTAEVSCESQDSKRSTGEPVPSPAESVPMTPAEGSPSEHATVPNDTPKSKLPTCRNLASALWYKTQVSDKIEGHVWQMLDQLDPNNDEEEGEEVVLRRLGRDGVEACARREVEESLRRHLKALRQGSVNDGDAFLDEMRELMEIGDHLADDLMKGVRELDEAQHVSLDDSMQSHLVTREHGSARSPFSRTRRDTLQKDIVDLVESNLDAAALAREAFLKKMHQDERRRTDELLVAISSRMGRL